MTPASRQKLRAAAMAATPSPWAHTLAGSCGSCVTAEPHDVTGECEREEDAAYIALAHPGAILELLDALDAADARHAKIRPAGHGPAMEVSPATGRALEP